MASSSAQGEEWCLLEDDGEEGGSVVFAGAIAEREKKLRSIERSNLLNMVKLLVKSLIESSMKLTHPIPDDHTHFCQFLIVLEQVFKHRLKAKKSLLSQRRYFWSAIEAFERCSADFSESISSVRAISGIKTLSGRGRAWLRFVLMQKKLGDLFRVMVEERRDVLREWYECDSVMVCEEGMVISGMLVGLAALDYNMTLAGDEFDRPVGVLDLSMHLRDGNYLAKPSGDSEEGGGEEGDGLLGQLLDQKAFLEELNKKLEASVDRLKTRLESVESTTSTLRERKNALEQQVSGLLLERDQLRAAEAEWTSQLQKKVGTLQDDQKAELETYVQTRSGLNDLYSASQKSLDSEMKLRLQTEREIEIQKKLRAETETALQLLEKSVHEKQDSIIALRKQLEELKEANLKTQSQLKSSKETHQRDSLKVRNLEGKLAQTTAHCKRIERELEDKKNQLKQSESTSSDLAKKLEEVQLAKSKAEGDLAIERQWRGSLQSELQKEKDRVISLTNENRNFRALKKEHAELLEKHACAQETVSEQEIALVEMGKQLSKSKQQVIDMREASSQQVWVDEKEVNGCQLCDAPFSVARRKHHCRNCGGVFCNGCSDNNMQLAVSSKPVRVCDGCYGNLLERNS